MRPDLLTEGLHASACSRCQYSRVKPRGYRWQPTNTSHRCRQSKHRQHAGIGCRRKGLLVQALDAAMPFDFEARAKQVMEKSKRLRIGIIGYGTFGQFLAARLVQAGHEVMATSRTDYSQAAAAAGVTFYSDANDLCEEHPEVVVLAPSILSLEAVLSALPIARLKRSTLIVDVLSVKEFPKRLMLSLLPPEVDVLCTHPMFGPDSGAGSWQGLNFMYDRVRISPHINNQQRMVHFLQFFEGEGCRMVEMSCEEHDRIAASTQFLTHTVGRVLGAMDARATSIDTRGYQSLLNLVDNTANDSFDLYYGLFMYNQNAIAELERLEAAFDHVKGQLLDRLHDVVRQQLFHNAPAVAESASRQRPKALPAQSVSRQPSENGLNGKSDHSKQHASHQ
ncbi:hypothetical protein WJX73_009784 [Symbiochloris irregularis]|uniref:Prephenate/arogenate dehydrogenase domain-containing protein n=1 Tax=Symbiochloris irregularis TaxID=706552 RepID=A0AAW1P504_9CHLO